ncbi:hypothetical protein CABS01_02158 [Colletotrichum abscissum]|uniref:uncharacterized protein n=1 Tax=Colletotrichum abscissum TaxID=1671311 RepID=UPI0027D49D46|nr:uncharacterized protein CABS01_02158 [Colletotrichum abscissum]KAK1488528.1 hypothetical protein CABS01_02158 [Colletotrichum abscissum]
MMSELDSAVAALGSEPHEIAHPTVDETDSKSHSSDSSDDQPSDSNSNPQYANDQLQSHLMQQLLTMANHPHPEAVDDPKSLRELIKEYESEVNVKDDMGMTPLHVAAEKGLVGAVEELIRAGADLETQDHKGFTPLMTATREQQVEVMRKLLKPPSEYSGDVMVQLEKRSLTGRTPILWASIYGFLDGVVLLIDAGADCDAQTVQSLATPLIAASFWGSEDIVKALLNTDNPRGRADLNLSDVDRRTALHAAVTGEHLEIAKLLLDVEATLTTLQDAYDQTPLHLAVDQGSESLVKLLASVDVNVFGASRQTALHLASKKGDKKVASWLLEANADIDAKDADDNTPLHVAFLTLLEVQEKLALKSSSAFLDLSMGDGPNTELRLQPDRLIATIQLLLENDAQIAVSNCREETPLRLAAACGQHSIFEMILKKMEQRDKSISNNDIQAVLSSALRLGVQRRAAVMATLLESDLVEVADFDQEDAWKDTLKWAASDPELHHIAQLLMRKMPRKQGVLPPCSKAWSAIGWAAHEQLPEVLFALISTCPETPDTETALSSTLESTLELVKRADGLQKNLDKALGEVRKLQEEPQSVTPTSAQKSRGEDYEDISRAKTGGLRVQERDGGQGRGNNEEVADTKKLVPGSHQIPFESKNLKTLKDILRDPPFARVHREPMAYDIPRSRIEKSRDDVLEKFKATIVQFYGAKGVSGTIQAKRPIREVIYDVGPKEMMQTWTAMQTAVAKLSEEVDEVDPDLFTRIMKDEKCGPRQYYEAKSFFQDSWLEVPDEKSDSRIVRPKAVLRQSDKAEDRNQEQYGEKNNQVTKKGRSRKSSPDLVATSAIYMPYFCFSVNLGNNREVEKDYKSLLEAYEAHSPQSVIHKSPTLDEWYYHFAKNQKSADDRDHRNRNQVVTKYWRREETREQTGQSEVSSMASGFTGELTLLRVNQVWIWTIGNKWLLTATSCLFSKCHGTLVEGILDQLSKQAKYGGRKSQPSSAVEMAKLIADYCIGSYERRPNSEIQPHKPPIDTVPSGSSKPVIGQQLSISQIYSNHMNQIGRAETALYNSFKYRERLQNEQDGLDSRVSKLLREWEAARISSNMEVAINKAEKLYSDIKDVRDELNILKSVAQYQQSVQRKLTPSQVKNADLTAAQVVSNIIELDVVADRIQLAQNWLGTKQG